MDDLLQRAEAGDAQAQFDLGMLYCRGKAIPHGELSLEYMRGSWQGDGNDYNEAFRLFKAAAEQGHVKAQTALAGCYFNGHGCRSSTRQFLKWCLLAAEAGDAEAQMSLGGHYDWPPGNETTAEFWLQKAVDQDHGWACYLLAQHRFDADQKYTPAAVDLLRQGSKQKAPPAHLDLGRCYAAGEGVEQNRIEAFAWLSVAAAERWTPADEELSKLILDMSPEELEVGKALAESYSCYQCSEE